MTKLKSIIFILVLTFTTQAHAEDYKLEKVNINVENKTFLGKGAQIYFNYCNGCHSIKYMRYNDLGKGVFYNTEDKHVSDTLRKYFMHENNDINENDIIKSGMNENYAQKWFGKAPPDLSLTAKYRGSDWIYTYMLTFYKDNSRPWGVNNLVYPNVGMPHVLVKYQGTQVLSKNKLKLAKRGELSQEEYKDLVRDLTTFLTYVSEPTESERNDVGLKVLIFLIFMTVVFYYLKEDYWKDIK